MLTEAHCVYDIPIAGIGFNPGDQFEAITGRTSISGGADAAIDVSAVRYLVSGPGGTPVLEARLGEDKGPQLYNPTTYSWDLAVLTLKTASSARPIQIAGPDEESTWAGGRPATASGWGSVGAHRADPARRPPQERLDADGRRRSLRGDVAGLLLEPRPGLRGVAAAWAGHVPR